MHKRLEHMKETLMCAVEMQLCNLGEVDTEELGEAIDMIKDLEEAIYYCTVTEAMKSGGTQMEFEMKNGEKEQHHKEDKMYYNTRNYMNSMPYQDEAERMYEDKMYARRRRADGTFYMDSGNNQSYAGGGQGGQNYAGGQGGQNYANSGQNYAGGQGGGQSYADNRGGQNYAGGQGGQSYAGGQGGGQSYMSYAERDSREGRSYNSRKMYMESKEMKKDKATQLRELEKYMQELSQDIVEMINDASPEEKQYLEKKISALASKVGQMK